MLRVRAKDARGGLASLLTHPTGLAVWCIVAAFGTYACMYGFRKPFTAGAFVQEPFEAGFKTWLVTAQVLGYTISKFVGIRVIASMPPSRRAVTLLGLVGIAQIALILFVAMLSRIPPPCAEDVAARSERTPMTRIDRLRWLQRHGTGLFLIAGAYLLITILRSLRADFAPELWKELSLQGQPALFTYTELWVALGVVLANGALFRVRDNRDAFFLSLALSGLGLVLLLAAAFLQRNSAMDDVTFMILAGFGLYVPYVAVHTTIFERLIAMTRDRGNAGYLMYFADAFGYLGYVATMLGRNWIRPSGPLLDFFLDLAIGGAALAFAAFAGAAWMFRRRTQVAPA